MKSKKGASAVVAWVLLLGFTIGLATTVFLWTTRQTEEMSQSTVRFVEGGMQCDNVMINVAKDQSSCKLTITNTRYLNIEKIVLRRIESPLSEECCKPLNVKDSVTVDKSGWTGNISVMPIVNINGELVGCTNKAINVECKP